jgi:curli biogenesis system outer membrane secretion channel CsgG
MKCSKKSLRAGALVAACALALMAGCATEKTRTGGKSPVPISDPGDPLQRCASRLGSAAITESEGNAQALTSAGLPRSMAPLMRQLLMQTGCFALLERGAGFAALEHEMRIREQQGEDRALQLAAMTAADYVIRSEIVFAEQTGGGKGAVGALFGSVLGGIGLEFQSKEALVVMTVVDARTSEIVVSSFGRGTTDSSALGSVVLGGGVLGLQGGWLDTPQAKPVAAALVDAWNRLLPRLLAAGAVEAPEAPTR